jgi:hypothetical protein
LVSSRYLFFFRFFFPSLWLHGSCFVPKKLCKLKDRITKQWYGWIDFDYFYRFVSFFFSTKISFQFLLTWTFPPFFCFVFPFGVQMLEDLELGRYLVLQSGFDLVYPFEVCLCWFHCLPIVLNFLWPFWKKWRFFYVIYYSFLLYGKFLSHRLTF